VGAVTAPPQGEAQMPKDVDTLEGAPGVVVAQIGLGVDDLRVASPRAERAPSDRSDLRDAWVVEQPGQ
jgi:hypothetical protein